MTDPADFVFLAPKPVSKLQTRSRRSNSAVGVKSAPSKPIVSLPLVSKTKRLSVKRTKEPSFSIDEVNWECWQCSKAFTNEDEYLQHILKCRIAHHTHSSKIPGCPFCPRNYFVSKTTSYNFEHFGAHMYFKHPEIEILNCLYCNEETDSLRALVCHITKEHRIYWIPCSESLKYLRRGEQMSRRYACLGCGLYTIAPYSSVSSAAVAFLIDHIDRCPHRGVRMQIPQLPDIISPELTKELIEKSDESWAQFCGKYQEVCGIKLRTAKPSISWDHGNQEPKRFKQSHSSEIMTVEEERPAEDSILSLDPQQPKRHLINIHRFTFDVPLNIPFPFKLEPGLTKRPQVEFTCPLCGQTVFGSHNHLDLHLQDNHYGELIFPCQLCGMAYPFYIGLRRHAIKFHNSEFDAVERGLHSTSNLVVNCPSCLDITFVHQDILNMHLNRMHSNELQQSNQSTAIIPVTSSESSLQNPNQDHSQLTKCLAATSGAGISLESSLSGKDSSQTCCKNLFPSQALRRNPRSTAPSESGIPSTSKSHGGLIAHKPLPFSPVFCHYCQSDRKCILYNPKEYMLHLQNKHCELTPSERIVCAICNRIFVNIQNLDRHNYVYHETNPAVVIHCPGREPEHSTPNIDGDDISRKKCDAKFTRKILLQSHLAASSLYWPKWSCPLKMALDELRNLEHLPQLYHDDLRLKLLATEIQIDAAGLINLTFYCNKCKCIFNGDGSAIRYFSHSAKCDAKIGLKTISL